MAQENAGSSNLESVNEIYAQRVGNLEAADEQVRDEQAEAEKGFDHPEAPLAEEQRFVANPEDLRKEVSSEDEFSAGLEDNPVAVEVGNDTVTEPADPGKATPAKKAAAKKTTAKKAAAK